MIEQLECERIALIREARRRADRVPRQHEQFQLAIELLARRVELGLQELRQMRVTQKHRLALLLWLRSRTNGLQCATVGGQALERSRTPSSLRRGPCVCTITPFV